MLRHLLPSFHSSDAKAASPAVFRHFRGIGAWRRCLLRSQVSARWALGDRYSRLAQSSSALILAFPNFGSFFSKAQAICLSCGVFRRDSKSRNDIAVRPSGRAAFPEGRARRYACPRSAELLPSAATMQIGSNPSIRTNRACWSRPSEHNVRACVAPVSQSRQGAVQRFRRCFRRAVPS